MTVETTPFHRSDIDRFLMSFASTPPNRKAQMFITSDGTYGYRCFVRQIFLQDVLIPNKSIHYVEDAAETWTNLLKPGATNDR